MDNRPTAVVTGASSGFGRRTAELLLASGWRVYATMRNVSSGNAAFAAELTAAGADVVELDVTSDDSVDAAASRILDRSGAPDLLVNNAGNGFFGAVETFTPDAVQRQFATNVIGPLRVSRTFGTTRRFSKKRSAPRARRREPPNSCAAGCKRAATSSVISPWQSASSPPDGIRESPSSSHDSCE